MMGAVGQPGPISSAASVVGPSSGITDRQLRRKTESLCRGLTELCLALAEDSVKAKQGQPAASTPLKETVPSPTATRFPGVAGQRRGSTLPEHQTPVKVVATSPRAPTTLEQRRLSVINPTALPSPRLALNPPTPAGDSSAVGRKSSLLIARTRRAGTEEPEEQTGRKSSLLRTRRAGTEEPEENREGRKTSLLVRSRKAPAGEDEDDARYRVPSRATTEVNSIRPTRELPSQTQAASPPDANSPGSSALPRRRLLPSSLGSRLISPAASALGSRRYLDRSTPERDTSSVVEKLAEDRGQRQHLLGQTSLLSRTGSINRRRDSAIPSLATSTQSSTYR